MFIGYINLIILMPHFFTPGETGMTRTILAIAVAMAQLTELGTSSIIYRFFPLYKKNNAKDFLSLITLIPLAGFCLLCLLGIVFEDGMFKSYYINNPELKQYNYLIFYLTFFTLVSAVGTNYCIVNLKTVFPKAINELIPKLGNTILILLFANKVLDFSQYFFWFCSLTAFSAVTIWIYIGIIGALKFDFNPSHLSKKVYKNIIKFGVVAILGSSFATILNYIDVIMLGGMRGQTDVATFSIGYYIINIMSVPFAATIAVVIPLLSSAIRHKKWDDVLKHYRQTSLTNFIIGSYIFILLLVIFPDIMNMLPASYAFDNALYIVLFMGIGRLLDMITGCNSEIIILSRHYMFNFYSIIVVSLLKIVMNYYLINDFGILGLSLSGLIILFLFNACRYLYIYYKMGIQPFTMQTLKAVILVIVLASVAWFALELLDFHIDQHKYYSALLQVVVKSVLWTLLFIPVMLFLKISPELNSFYKLIISRLSSLLKI